MRTTNGGDNWEEIDIDSSENFFFFDIFFVDKYNGWLVVSELGGGYDHYLLKTTDGGDNWIELFGFGNQTVFLLMKILDGTLKAGFSEEDYGKPQTVDLIGLTLSRVLVDFTMFILPTIWMVG